MNYYDNDEVLTFKKNISKNPKKKKTFLAPKKTGGPLRFLFFSRPKERKKKLSEASFFRSFVLLLGCHHLSSFIIIIIIAREGKTSTMEKHTTFPR